MEFFCQLIKISKLRYLILFHFQYQESYQVVIIIIVPKTNGLKFEKKTSDKEEFINIFNFHKRIGALKSVSHKLKVKICFHC
ncbi:hypothetical protein Avbf_18718 [Armadillidium vulgare]|nr:hypothetical protein Avbf_18718 [Armadillidium vulgare]